MVLYSLGRVSCVFGLRMPGRWLLCGVEASLVLRCREAVSSPCREPSYLLLLAQKNVTEEKGTPAYAVPTRWRATGTRIGAGFSAVHPAPSKRARHPCRAPCGLFHLNALGCRWGPRSRASRSLRIALGFAYLERR